MKQIFILFLLLFFLTGFNSSAQDPERFFKEEDLINTGIFYYPEHWDQSQWERDFRNMAEMGFEYVHMAEFAWAFLEPEEGKYDFSWLDKAIALAGKYKLKVILCTPTATSPVWMGIKYPDTYLVDENYRRKEHGSRQNNSIASPDFQRLTKNIVEKLAQHYGQNENVWGWQIDNEPGAKADYSKASQEAFRKWVKEKYKTIEALNEAWGAAFWSITYGSFDQVRIPNAHSINWWGFNPHMLLDFKRFTADLQADFLDMQAKILREHIAPEQFITTNYVSLIFGADPRLTENLDFIAYTCYPNSGSENLGDLGFRLGSHLNLAFANDYFRPIKGVTGVLEIQPGQVNWGRINPLLLPGAVRMWLWHSYAAGGSIASSYRYRQPLYGVEQYHSGVIKTDGITPSQGGKDYMKFMKEMKELRKAYNSGVAYPQKLEQRRTAILWSHENWWDHSRQPQSAQWNLMGHVQKYHEILKSFGAPTDLIAENDDLGDYNVVIVPAYQAVDSGLVEQWKNYAENGGHLILTCRTGTKTRQGHLWEGGMAVPIYNLIGAEISNYDQLLESETGEIIMDGKSYGWNNWADLLEPETGTAIWATYTDQFYSPKAAVISRKLGHGTVTYIGVDTDDAQLERDVLNKVYSLAGIPVENYPQGVFVNWRDGFWIGVNYTSENQALEIPQDAEVLVGDELLEPAGVVVWR